MIFLTEKKLHRQITTTTMVLCYHCFNKLDVALHATKQFNMFNISINFSLLVQI